MKKAFVSVSVLSAFLSSSALAGTYTVMENGRGDFDSIQTAVDTVPEGSTLLVTGNFAEEVTIKKSIRIVGGTIYSSGNLFDLIEIQGADWVILDGITIPNSESGGDGSYGHAIHVQDVRFFALQNATVFGQYLNSSWYAGCGVFPSGFDSVWLERVGYARISSCYLFGAKGTEVYAFGDPGFCGEYDIKGGVGGAGLRVDQSFVVVEDTTAMGGAGGDAFWNDWEGLNQPPNSLVGGDGGNGVNGDVWSDACYFVSGAAGTWKYDPYFDWGIGSDGNTGVPVNGVETPLALPEKLTVSDLVIGQPATISGQGFQSSSIALLFFATDVDPPLAIRQGAWMLELPWVFVDRMPTDGAGNFTLQTTIPDDPSLVALLFFLQVADFTTISEPEELIFSD